MANDRSLLTQGARAVCNFDADAAAPAFRQQRGFTGAAGITRNGAGDYTLTLTEEIGANAMLFATTNAGAGAMIDAVRASATTVRVRSLSSAAMAADNDFCLMILELGPN